MNDKKKLLLRNTYSSLIFQITTIVCGFILPRAILGAFGSEVNGLVQSISQFLSIISFLELGVGAVIQSSLYKPLAEKNNILTSQIIASGQKFFTRIGQILLVYIIFLMIVYPYIANQNFGFLYTSALIGAISISYFSQYYFGVVDRLLLTADQHGYIQYNAQTITLVLNTISCLILIKLGASIHLVKLTTSLIYLVRPIYLRMYVNHHYQLDRKIKYTGEPIKQKWNGIAQHVAAVILDQTDIIVLTLLSTLSNVSIYSVYSFVVIGVKQLFMSMTNGIQALEGEYYSENNKDELKGMFLLSEWAIHSGTVLIFTCTEILIVPFVTVYTMGIHDANYYQPLFAALLTLANAGHCLRLPYNIMILAAGHYKQTQSNYIIAAVMNIVISIILVKKLGLIGVAIGTLIAMFYQTIWMSVYCSRNLVYTPYGSTIKQFLTDIITTCIIILSCRWIHIEMSSYFTWVIMALIVFLIALAITIIINWLLYRENISYFIRQFTHKGNK